MKGDGAIQKLMKCTVDMTPLWTRTLAIATDGRVAQRLGRRRNRRPHIHSGSAGPRVLKNGSQTQISAGSGWPGPEFVDIPLTEENAQWP